MLAYLKRDYIAYFYSPIGWIIIAVVALFGGFFLATNITFGSVSVAEEILFLRSALFLIIPLITMRLFAEERKNNTEILLYTSPVKLSHVVISKYLSSLALFLTIHIILFFHMLVVSILGGRVDATAFGALIGFFLIGSVFLSFGVLASALTENQIVAAVISLTIIFFTQYIAPIAQQFRSFVVSFLNSLNFLQLQSSTIQNIGNRVEQMVLWIDPYTRTSNFFIGVFSLGSIVYSLGVVVIFLFITYQVLDKKRWS